MKNKKGMEKPPCDGLKINRMPFIIILFTFSIGHRQAAEDLPLTVGVKVYIV